MYNETTVRGYVGRHGITASIAFFSSADFPDDIKKCLEGIIFNNGILNESAVKSFA